MIRIVVDRPDRPRRRGLCAGRSRRRSPASSSASTRSTSPTSRRPSSSPARSWLDRGRRRSRHPAGRWPEDGRLALYGDAALRLTAGDGGVVGELARHLARRQAERLPRLQAFIAPTPDARRGDRPHPDAAPRDRTGRATTAGYGPRFLHSTGQLHKGGAPIGWFLQLTADHPADLDDPRLAVHLRPAHRRPGGRRLRRHRIPRPADRPGPPRRRHRTPGWRRSNGRCAAAPRPDRGGLTSMRIGFIGLGRMGANMVRRLVRDGHEIVVYNRTPEKTTRDRRGRGRDRRRSRSPSWSPRSRSRARSGSWSRPATPPRPRSTSCSSTSSRATRSSTAATRTSTTMSAATPRSPRRASATSTPARRAGSGASRSATA